MLSCFIPELEPTTVPIIPIAEQQLDTWAAKQDERTRNWLKAVNFKAKSGATSLICGEKGQLEKVLVGMRDVNDVRVFGQLAVSLPRGSYHVDVSQMDALLRYQLFLAWGMGSYQFTPYKKSPPLEAKLYLPKESVHQLYLESVLRATYLVRDMVNTPADDMMPADIAEVAINLADEFKAKVTQIIGEDLLKQNFPTVYTVGRASVHPPRVIDLRWGKPEHPKVTIVGKGVCFDSGGLDLKSASNMGLMKKDMAGGAHALGIARVIMALQLPVNLRILIPAVENAVSGEAYHPGDVIVTRKGTTVEVTNTDAEGRLILSDVLYAAAAEKPDVLIDFATLTGAARVALGTEISVFFTPDEALAKGLYAGAETEHDPVWQLPLYAPYRKLLDSKIADMVNSASSPYGGAITAAVFLKEFVADGICWAHFDVMAWNVSSKPAMPEGGEASALRAVVRYICQRFSKETF
jgi:leucyl aminopeptidase